MTALSPRYSMAAISYAMAASSCVADKKLMICRLSNKVCLGKKLLVHEENRGYIIASFEQSPLAGRYIVVTYDSFGIEELSLIFI